MRILSMDTAHTIMAIGTAGIIAAGTTGVEAVLARLRISTACISPASSELPPSLRPYEYLLRRRIEQAQENLAGTRKPRVDIASFVWFQDAVTVHGRLLGASRCIFPMA